MKKLVVISLILITSLYLAVRDTLAQPTVPVTIALRYADGAPVAGEEVRLTSHPSLTTETAVTNTGGQCVFNISRGLYEVAFTPRLDEVSALAVAEGGLHGFGITVGDEAITYHFTFQANGHVYFDSAPEAVTPVPIKPQLEDMHFIGGAGQPTPTALPATTIPESDTNQSPAPVTATPIPALETESSEKWKTLFFISVTGVTIGLIGFMVSKRRHSN